MNEIKSLAAMKLQERLTEPQAIELLSETFGKYCDLSKVIGTDVSLDVCITEGYLMTFDTLITESSYLRFFAFAPDYLIREQGNNEYELMIDTEMSLNYLLEKYSVHKEGIDKFADCDYSTDASTYESVSQVLGLADIVNAYCGLH